MRGGMIARFGVSRPRDINLAGHVGILQTHGPTKVAAFLRLIVIGFRPNPV